MHKIDLMNLILSDLKTRLLSPVAILCWLAGSIVSALAGPFDTYSLNTLDERLLFWGGILLVATVLSSAMQISIRYLTPRWSILKQTGVCCGSFILVYWVFILFIVDLVYGHLVLPHPLLLLAVVAGVSTSIFTMIYLVSPKTLGLQDTLDAEIREQPEQGTVPEIPITNGANGTLKRLGLEHGHKLIRLAMRDHYIEVFTEEGSKLVHMRFADALQDVARLNGDQIHRSHWVSFDEIDSIVKDGAKIGFRMSDGAVVPIARSQKARLKEQGLI